MSGRSVGQLLDLYQNIVRFGLKMTELEPRMRILPSSIELSGAYSRHAYNTLEQFLKCTIVLSTCVPFGSAKIGQTAIYRQLSLAAVQALVNTVIDWFCAAVSEAGEVLR